MRWSYVWIVGILIAALVLLALRTPSIPRNELVRTEADIAFVPDTEETRARDSTDSELSEEALTGAVAAICDGYSAGPQFDQLSDADRAVRRYEYDAIRAATSAQLASSQNPEHLHVAALLEEHEPTQLDLLHRALAEDSSDAFLLWSAVRICSAADDPDACPLEEWLRLLISVDSHNSESWIRFATNRYAAGDRSAALEAVNHASAATESHIYWIEMLRSIERGYATTGDVDHLTRVSMAFSAAAGNIPSFAPALNMCRDEAAQSDIWAQACLAYGERVEALSRTEVVLSIGQSFQYLALDGLGELNQANEVRERERARYEEMHNENRDRNPAVELVLFSDPTLFSAYLTSVRMNGERAAREQFATEIEQLLERQPELACVPPL